MNLEKKYDLVFSQSVIDHVYDIDLFTIKIANATKKYAYISSYRGYFAALKKHKMEWRDNDGCYYNDVSASRLKRLA